jgi:hypothetical protein
VTGGVTLVFRPGSKRIAKPLRRQVMDLHVMSTLEHTTLFEHKSNVSSTIKNEARCTLSLRPTTRTRPACVTSLRAL